MQNCYFKANVPPQYDIIGSKAYHTSVRFSYIFQNSVSLL